ncbi:uncharacterized protein LOC133293132 [Gastrolobium bilobum]|uniref:uncharacterized protein LOC133293132 n=1 Tax=Gastrolobium bilobum TaxID=150636 RepID=UPI002AB20EB8|nr:uncharacterized protein LOC133293132 [Gastrolobium bilobum]
MATNSVQGKWDHVEEEEEDEEEEALSLSDLPITHEDQSRKEDTRVNNETHEEFDFHSSWGGLFSKEEPEMCVADEVFFQGQILPLRLSFSSEAGLLTNVQRDGKKFNRCESSSESLDHGSIISEFQSNSSRSSSLRSQNSSSSTSSTTTPRISKPNVQNQFHTHPSPKPQLRVSDPRRASFGNQSRNRKSSAWEIFRLGVVPTPEIGLQDLKVRSTNSANKNSVSRNSSSSSSNSTTKSVKMSKNYKSHHHSDKSNHIFKQFVGKGGGLMSGCNCSIEAVESDMVMIKGGTKSIKKTESVTHAVKEKVVELKKQKQRQKQGKKVMSRRRTFEWLKELHASHADEEALLSNP